MAVGTANYTELASGFFVRHGDGAGDLFPLQHLYKTEVRSLALELGVPRKVVARESTSDTFSAAQSQEEFFFGLPEELYDLVLFAYSEELAPDGVADDLGIDRDAVAATYADIRRRQPFLRWLNLIGREV